MDDPEQARPGAALERPAWPPLLVAGVPVLFVLAWSSAYVVGALGIRSTPPFTLTFFRFGLATACMAAVAVGAGARWPSGGRELGHIAFAGMLVQGVQFLGVYSGIKLGVPAAISSLLIGVNPVVTALIAWPALGERTTRRQRWGFLLGVVGVVLAVVQGLHLSSEALVGVGFTLLGLIAISAGTVYQKRFCSQMDLRSGQAIQLLASTILAGVCAVAFEHIHTDDPATLLFSVSWLAVINSIGAVSLLYLMVRRDQAGRASTMFFLVPSVTALLATVTLDEPLSPAALVGFAVAAAGVLMATYGVGRADRRTSRSVQSSTTRGRQQPSSPSPGRPGSS